VLIVIGAVFVFEVLVNLIDPSVACPATLFKLSINSIVFVEVVPVTCNYVSFPEGTTSNVSKVALVLSAPLKIIKSPTLALNA